MNFFHEGTIESAENFVPEAEKKHDTAFDEKATKCAEKECLKKLEFWKDRIEDALDGEYGEGEVFAKKEEGIEHVTSKKSTFFVIAKNQPIPMLSRSLRDLLKESGFVESEGSVNFVYSKALEKDVEKKKGSLLSRFF